MGWMNPYWKGMLLVLLCTQFLIWWSHCFLLRLSPVPLVPTVLLGLFSTSWTGVRPTHPAGTLERMLKSLGQRGATNWDFAFMGQLSLLEPFRLLMRSLPDWNGRGSRLGQAGVFLLPSERVLSQNYCMLSRVVKMRLLLPASRPWKFFFF